LCHYPYLMHEDIQKTIFNLPASPGVYIWKDQGGKMLYVGKAVSLRDRLRNYLNPQDEKTKRLVDASCSLETVLTKTASEALVLEDALVKQNQPRYNILLRDDKRYPYIRLTVGEEFPRIELARRVVLDHSRYFGPYTDAPAVRRVIRLVGDYFGIRQCRNVLKTVKRPCINHSMGKCSAPCRICNKQDYLDSVRAAAQFLKGDSKSLARELRLRMRAFSEKGQFEKAIEVRDTLNSIVSLSTRQNLSSSRLQDMDVIGYGFLGGRAAITQMTVRHHSVVAVLHHPLKGEYADDPAAAIGAFIKQHYGSADLVPKLMITSWEPNDKALLEGVLLELTESPVRIVCPKRGQKRKLTDLASENSVHQLQQDMLKRESPDPLELLMQILRLSEPPGRIEAYDISNLGAQATVGSMVVFTDGAPDKSQYRRFAIRQPGQDDPANMAEMLQRRFEHDEWKTPNIVLLDGGKGQLHSAMRHIPPGVTVIALAKRDEELYLPGRTQPLRLAKNNPALLLLRHARDEAHRFGRKYHRLKRGKEFLT
jgi:excinuclease ABC subunit C